MLAVTSYGVKVAGHGQIQINRKHSIRSAMGVSNLVYTDQYTASSCRTHHNHLHRTTHLTITTPITVISCEQVQLMLERPPSPTPLRRICHAGAHWYNQIRDADHFEAGADNRRTNSFLSLLLLLALWAVDGCMQTTTNRLILYSIARCAGRH